MDNLDINNIYQCIIERNKSGSYWLHIGLKTQNRQNQSTSFTVMVQINNDADFFRSDSSFASKTKSTASQNIC